jgi:predicted GIY-YIG superfamily endonuclease
LRGAKGDEAIHTATCAIGGLLRFARNDGANFFHVTCGFNEEILRQPCVYIMASERHGTIYTGVTCDVSRRAYDHRNGLVKGFTERYRCHDLVFCEYYARMDDAIGREKQIKAGSRKKKIALIEANNPHWGDLYGGLA